MILCIAEKPSVARDIASILGATSRHEGYLEGNGYCVTWVFGHLCELKAPEDYSPAWKRWSLGQLPMIPPRFGIRLKADKGVKRQFQIIADLVRKADRIVNCGDAGQEGELIQRWVLQKAGAQCPVDRLWISSLTEESIREGFQSLKPQSDYDLLYQAGLCRAVGDWLLGMNATRLYTLKYRPQQYGQPPLSIGRVQTPTLALIVARQQEIEHFRPEPYWVLTTLYRDTTFTAVMADPNAEEESEEKGKDNGKSAARRGFSTEAEAVEAMERIRQSPFEITAVQKKKGSEAPPRLFDLTALQVECNKKFGFSADRTLQLVQSLYEKKVTTYPRVDTTYLSEDIYGKCKSILNGIALQYGNLLQPLRGAKLRKSKKVFDSSKVTDHHAIIPTGQRADILEGEEQKVFDLIARRFIAVFYPDCLFSTTTVWGEAAEVPFKATGKVVLQAGWREVFSKQETAEEEERTEEERSLPHFVKGERGSHVPSLAEKATQPPKPYTEATLLRAMETAGRQVESEDLREALKENGIGRPSTRAAIIETLFKRQYIAKQRKTLYATPTGIALISLIEEDLLKSAELTGHWEKKLREIERREYSAPAFIEELKQMVTEIVLQVLSDNSQRRVSSALVEHHKAAATSSKKAEQAKAKRLREGSLCPLCGEGKLIKGKTALGCSRWKEGCDFRKPIKVKKAN